MPAVSPQDNKRQVTDFSTLPCVLTAADLSRLLRRSVKTVRRWERLGLLPASRLGTWNRDEVRAWLDAGRPSRETWERYGPKAFRRLAER